MDGQEGRARRKSLGEMIGRTLFLHFPPQRGRSILEPSVSRTEKVYSNSPVKSFGVAASITPDMALDHISLLFAIPVEINI